MAWTADDLISAVRVRAQMPDAAGDGAITDADILTLANEEIALRLVPLVRRSRGDYFVSIHDVTIVSGTASYRVPTRAQTSGLRELTLVDSAAREVPIPQMHLEDAGPANVTGGPLRFYMQGPNVVLVPSPTVSGYTLRMRYHRSHPTLVLAASAGLCTWDGVSATIALSGFPVAWDTLPAFETDIYYILPPFGVAALDASVTNVVGNDATVTGLATLGLPVDTTLGIALQYETDVVDLPRECWALLVSAVTARVCEVIGDRDAAALAFGLYDRESANIMTLLTPRVEGNKQVIVDRFSTLRGGRRGWR